MKRLFSLLTVLALLLSLAGCGSSGAVIRYDSPSPITNLDPQFATDPTARIVISNTFEGLFRQLPSGEIIPCLAESYTLSADGLTYTFHLRKDAAWSGNSVKVSGGGWAGGQPVTAHDFAFALTRMFDSAAFSPFAGEFSCIKHAEGILNGTLSASALGVRALDDATLEIQLERPDNLLPERLAASYSMPCNQAFFKSTMARYGLDRQSLLSNGPFSVRTWADTLLSLRQNPYYVSEEPTTALGVDFYVTGDQAETRFLNGVTDAAKVSFHNLPAVREAGGTVSTFEDTVWVLLLNNRLDYFSNADIRRAVAHAVDRELFQESLPANLRVASTLVPPAVFFMGWPYRTLAGEDSPVVSSSELAKRYQSTGLEDLALEKLPTLKLLVCDQYDQPKLAGYLQQGITRSLSVYCGLEVVGREALLSRVNAGDFQMAVVPLSAAFSSPDAMLSHFRSDAGTNLSAYSDEAFDALLSASTTQAGPEQFSLYEQAENRLLETGGAIPLYFETTYYASAKGVTGLDFSPFVSDIYFKFAQKE